MSSRPLQSEASGLGEAPPVFTPPDVPAGLLPPEMVIVTQPTPQPGEGEPAGEPQVTGQTAEARGERLRGQMHRSDTQIHSRSQTQIQNYRLRQTGQIAGQ